MARMAEGVAVIGAGIAGLATATGLADAGIPVRVYEQAEALGEVGAGVSLAPNSLRVLDSFGLTERLSEIESREPLRMAFYNHEGVRSEDSEVDARGARPIHRADLIDVLSWRLEPDALRLGARLVAVDETDDGLVLRFADGSTETAAAVIGADGIHSAVRPFVVDSPEPVFSGMVAYRGLVPAERLPDWPIHEAQLFTGPGRHFICFPVRRAKLLNFVAFVAADDEMRESWSAPGDPAELAKEFAGWNESVRGLIDRIDRTFRWGLYDREPLPTWVRGRVALAGDAAHAMLPHVGQGGNQSIEDAAALVEVLRDRPPAEVASAFQEYDRARRERASYIQRFSRRLGLQYDGRHAEFSTTDQLADREDVMRWIFSHDSALTARQVRAGGPSVSLPVGAAI